jgi:hypothetical protein
MALKSAVAILIFNRPDTTARVFEAIRQARPPRLLVVADGPRADRPAEAELCAATRAIVEQVDWPCSVQRNYSPTNLGCRERVASGLEWVFGQVEEAIILEDDCLPEASFFPFCQQLLERYRHDERIMMIGGTNYLLDRLQIRESYFFSRYYPIWGWASWRRAWKKYDLAMGDWPRLKSQGQLRSFYSQGFMRSHVARMFDAAYHGRINTWDIQWFYSCLFNNGLSLIPRVNLISNIGLVGTHTSGDTSNNFFPLFPIETEELLHPQQAYPDFVYDGEFFRKKLKSGALDMLRKLIAASGKRLKKAGARLNGSGEP